MRFADVVNQKPFSLVVQMDPPKGADPKPLLDSALAVRGRVDAFSFTDNQMAVMKMHPLAPCHLLRQKHVETILTLNSRDRNRLSLQSELLAAWALDIRAVLFHAGEDPTYGDHPLAAPCRDLSLEGMMEAAASFRAGRDLSGQALEPRPDFFTGVTVPVTDDAEKNRARARELPGWARAGARFAVLGSTYDAETVREFAGPAREAGLKVFASVLLLKSYGMAKYLNSVPGVPDVPEAVLARIAAAPLKPRAGLEVAADFVRQLAPLCDGVFLVPLGWESRVPELLDLMTA